MTDQKAACDVGRARPLEETHPDLKTFIEFLDDFNKETERGAALSSMAYIDHLLERTLAAFLIPNDSGAALTTGFNAPLGTFSARIAACHAMGLISEDETKECNLLGRTTTTTPGRMAPWAISHRPNMPIAAIHGRNGAGRCAMLRAPRPPRCPTEHYGLKCHRDSPHCWMKRGAQTTRKNKCKWRTPDSKHHLLVHNKWQAKATCPAGSVGFCL